MITNKLFVRTICTVLVGITILSAGCGNVGELSDAASIEESTKQKNTDAVLYGPLVAPTVKDGIIELGDGFIPVCFEWNAVEGADGYQIWEESKSRSEETYHEPEYDSALYTSETYYLANAQENNIDFRIKVRAYRGDGDNWEYSEWSEYAYGSSYENDNSYVKDDNIEYKYESGDKKIPKIP